MTKQKNAIALATEQGGMRGRARPSQRREDFYIRRDKSFNRRNEIKGDDQEMAICVTPLMRDLRDC